MKNRIITVEELLQFATFATQPEKFSNKKKSDTCIFSIDEQQEKDNAYHLKIKELKLDHRKQLQAIRSEMKIFQKAMYRATEINIYAHNTHNIIQSSFA